MLRCCNLRELRKLKAALDVAELELGMFRDLTRMQSRMSRHLE